MKSVRYLFKPLFFSHLERAWTVDRRGCGAGADVERASVHKIGRSVAGAGCGKSSPATGQRCGMTLLERLGEAVEEVVESAIRTAPFRDLVDRMEHRRVVLPAEGVPDLLE